jgi:hypothetical protein
VGSRFPAGGVFFNFLLSSIMSGIGQTFSSFSHALTDINRKVGIGGGRASVGPFGPSNPRERGRRAIDPVFGVPPVEGDPGYVPPPTPPVVTPVTPMPVPGQDELANIEARRRSISEQLARRGRASTILSNPQTEPLGG